MIDHNKILLRLTRITPGEALDLVTEMSGVVNSITVQLREGGHDVGEPGDRASVASRLLRVWSLLYDLRPLLAAMDASNVAVDAPIWIGDEPPLDESPSPV